MATKRDSYSDTEHSILYAETEGCCPLCTLPLHFQKPGSKKPSKGYEVAHIYPLSPTQPQAIALVGYPVPTNINALDNVIALCPTCHTKYDKDFKLDELKKVFLAAKRARKAEIDAHKPSKKIKPNKDYEGSLPGNSGNSELSCDSRFFGAARYRPMPAQHLCSFFSCTQSV